MKNIFLICSCAFLTFSGCIDNVNELLTSNNIDVTSSYDTQICHTTLNDTIETRLFDVINLNYPGLEKVREFYEAGKLYNATSALLEYYRNRTEVNNPNINLVNPTISPFNQNIADQALEYKFYVRSFYESKDENGIESYYSFWDENQKKINWNANLDKETSQEFKYQLHRHQWMLPQAIAYFISKDEKYIQSWIEVYSDWLNTFPHEPGTVFPPEGGAGNDKDYQWKGLQVAERVTSQVDIMPYFIHSINFTPEWLSIFLSTFEKEVESIRLNYYLSSNHSLSQAQAITTAGILMPEFKNSEVWATEGASKMNEEMDKQLLEDGVHFELDPSYHIASISSFREIYDLAKVNNKVNLLPASYISKLKKATEFVKDIIYPNYTLDNFNDTRASSYTKSVLLKNLKIYASMYPDDQEMLWMSTEGKKGTTPTHLTSAYEESGYYMIRNGWGKSSTMMILKNNNNPDQQWHCQPDNGTFGLYRNTRNFFPDAGVYSYNTDSNRANYRATKNHNTLTVMSKTIGEEQGGVTEGKLLKLETLNNIDILVTENASYNNITHRRAIFYVNKNFFVIADEGYGSIGSNKVNLNFHMLTDKTYPTVYDDLKSSKQYGAHTTFTDNNNMLIRTFSETEQDFSVTTSTSKISNKLGDNTAGSRAGYQYTIRQPKTTESIPITAARFISVIYPFGDISEINNLNIDAKFIDNENLAPGTFHPKGISIKVTINGQEYDLSYSL